MSRERLPIEGMAGAPSVCLDTLDPPTEQDETMKLPTMRVMTCPGDDRRTENVKELCRQYSGPSVMHNDEHRQGILWNHRNILQAATQEDTPSKWVLVVQDDIRLCEGFEEQLQQVMVYAPTPFVSLFHIGGYGNWLAEKGAPFGTGLNVMWGPAVLYRKAILPHYLKVVETVWELGEGELARGERHPYWKWDDGIVPVFCKMTGVRASVTARALVEHRNWESTVGNQPGKHRTASRTIENSSTPRWGVLPRSRPLGVSMSANQRELYRKVVKARKVQP